MKEKKKHEKEEEMWQFIYYPFSNFGSMRCIARNEYTKHQVTKQRY